MSTSDDETAAGYDVGYRRPPVEHRFQKGRSGNPGGKNKAKARKRPAADDILSVFGRECERVVETMENGRSVRLTMNEAIMRRLVHLAVKGDASALKQYIILKRQADTHRAETTMPEAEDLAKISTAEIFEQYYKFVRMTTPR